MNTFRILFTAIFVITTSFNRPAGLTDAERNYATTVLTQTRETLLAKVKSLTPAQLAFKADPASWSVAECIEHIAITESGLFNYAQAALKVPADPSKRDSVKFNDQQILDMIADRSAKFQAQGEVLPTGKFGDVSSSLKEFVSKRDKHIGYIKTTTDDLRNHYLDFPFGKLDAYQGILFMAGHCKRHTAQIDEIIQNPGFPKTDK